MPAVPTAPKTRPAIAGRLLDRPAHDGDDHHVVEAPDALDVAPIELVLEFPRQRIHDRGRRLREHEEADALLGRGLRDHRDAGAGACDGAEGARGDTRHAEHAAAFDRDQALRRIAVTPLNAARRVLDVAEHEGPGCDGLNVFRMRIGIPRSSAGSTVFGCSTFAPK